MQKSKLYLNRMIKNNLYQILLIFLLFFAILITNFYLFPYVQTCLNHLFYKKQKFFFFDFSIDISKTLIGLELFILNDIF